MVEKAFDCTLCPKSFHTPEAKNEHTQLRHKNETIDPSDHSAEEWTQRVVINSSVAPDQEAD